jgi:hypothetical protein
MALTSVPVISFPRNSLAFLYEPLALVVEPRELTSVQFDPSYKYCGSGPVVGNRREISSYTTAIAK